MNNVLQFCVCYLSEVEKCPLIDNIKVVKSPCNQNILFIFFKLFPSPAWNSHFRLEILLFWFCENLIGRSISFPEIWLANSV